MEVSAAHTHCRDSRLFIQPRRSRAFLSRSSEQDLVFLISLKNNKEWEKERPFFVVVFEGHVFNLITGRQDNNRKG